MIKRFVYIVLLLIFASKLSSAKANSHHSAFLGEYGLPLFKKILADTSKKNRQQEEEKKKIKEVAKARHQSKPEKIDENGNAAPASKIKPKRQRRPEGLERPPEIPRRNGN